MGAAAATSQGRAQCLADAASEGSAVEGNTGWEGSWAQPPMGLCFGRAKELLGASSWPSLPPSSLRHEASHLPPASLAGCVLSFAMVADEARRSLLSCDSGMVAAWLERVPCPPCAGRRQAGGEGCLGNVKERLVLEEEQRLTVNGC